MYFSYSRTAFKLILMNLLSKNENKDELLVPDFICNSILDHIKDLKIKLIFYKINENFAIDWLKINNTLNKNKILAILVVNYFGFPIHIYDSLKFSIENNITLIEDNSHGFKGYYDQKELGTFGNFGFSSPRKHIPIRYGGILYKKIDNKFDNNLDTEYHFSLKDKISYLLNSKFLNHKLRINKFFKKPLSNLKFDKFENYKDSRLDIFCKNLIENSDWDKIRRVKMKNYKNWSSFFNSNLPSLIFNYNKFPDVNPWCYPTITNNEKESIDLINWAKNNLSIAFSWPSLPSDVDKSSYSYDLSRKLICFSTYKF